MRRWGGRVVARLSVFDSQLTSLRWQGGFVIWSNHSNFTARSCAFCMCVSFIAENIFSLSFIVLLYKIFNLEFISFSFFRFCLTSKFFNISICLFFLLPPRWHVLSYTAHFLWHCRWHQRKTTKRFPPIFSSPLCNWKKRLHDDEDISRKLDIQIMNSLVWIFFDLNLEFHLNGKKSPLLTAARLKRANTAASTFSVLWSNQLKAFSLLTARPFPAQIKNVSYSDDVRFDHRVDKEGHRSKCADVLFQLYDSIRLWFRFRFNNEWIREIKYNKVRQTSMMKHERNTRQPDRVTSGIETKLWHLSDKLDVVECVRE